ncbi:hypothetical protein [Streptomyces albogriseolus]|uniref:hypothetical protein n=1 Tax=Streptomyces albogriseolus TaxID=1887 RepID=UPI00345F273D
MDSSYSPNPDWDNDDWHRETTAVRDALAALGVIVPTCLPGEPGDCGAPAWTHYAGYLALLKARTQTLILANLGEQPGPPDTGISNLAHHTGHHLYEEELSRMLKELE